MTSIGDTPVLRNALAEDFASVLRPRETWLRTLEAAIHGRFEPGEANELPRFGPNNRHYGTPNSTLSASLAGIKACSRKF